MPDADTDWMAKALAEIDAAIAAHKAKLQENKTNMTSLNDAQTTDKPDDKKPTHVDVVAVERHGSAIILPEKLTVERAIKVLEAKRDYDNQTVEIHALVEGFIFDVAHAFHAVLTEKFGWANSVPTPGFFGPKPPVMLSVPVGPGKVIQVPWGRFKLPGMEEASWLACDAQPKDGRLNFVIAGSVKRAEEAAINEIVEAVKLYVKEHSVYRGQAFRMRTRDEDGDMLPMPEPRFLDLNPNIESELTFSDEVLSAIKTNLFTPIERTKEVRAIGVPLKRGILLAGEYGTGKTMAAHATAIKAVRHGWTYLVCERAEELADMLRLAREYAPAVVFCEDIDRVMQGDRTIDVDHILNVIDGVESKSAELMIVLTTNAVDKITQAMLRPGRLDAVIHVAPPDAKAAERLARMYSRGLIADTEDISGAAQLMAGRIAAVIRETVERAKLSAVSLSQPGEPLSITNAALLDAARTMEQQIRLLTPKPEDNRSNIEKASSVLADAIREGRVEPETASAAALTLDGGADVKVKRTANGHVVRDADRKPVTDLV